MSDPVDRLQWMLVFFMSGLTDLVSWPKPTQQILCNFLAMFLTLPMKLPVHHLPARLKGRKELKRCHLSCENVIPKPYQISRVLFQKSTNPYVPLVTLCTYGFKIFSILIAFLPQHQFIIFMFSVSPKVLFQTFFTVHNDNAQSQQLERMSIIQMPLSVALKFFSFQKKYSS